MKNNLIIILILFIITSCSIVHHEEKFVNPLFYERLKPVSQEARLTLLTPTSIKYSNDIDYVIRNEPKEGWTEGQCQLLENTEYYIVLKCTYHNQKYMYDGATFISKFSMDHCGTDRFGNCRKLYVTEEDIEKDGHVSGWTTYAIDIEEVK